MKVIMAIYNFLVGDIVILIGIIITLAVLAIINNVSLFSSLRSGSGLILIVAALVVLAITLGREARGKR